MFLSLSFTYGSVNTRHSEISQSSLFTKALTLSFFSALSNTKSVVGKSVSTKKLLISSANLGKIFPAISSFLKFLYADISSITITHIISS